MKRGAIAMIDALGWKGIWAKHPPDALISHMQKLRTVLEQRDAKTRELLARQHPQRMKPVDIRTTFLSDTIVIAGSFTEDAGRAPPEFADCYLGWVVGMSVVLALDTAVRCDFPLVYRGAIAIGEYLVDGPFLIGPAIDEAAEFHGRADAGLVLYAPSAASSIGLFRAPPSPQGGLNPSTMTFEHEVHMKDGSRSVVPVVNPFGICTEWAHLVAISEGFKKALGTDPEFAAKRTNTLRFLEEAHAHWTSTRKGWQ